jgi:hypothetical protein
MVDELGLLEDPIVPFVTTRSLDDYCLLLLFKVFLAPPLLSPHKTPTPAKDPNRAWSGFRSTPKDGEVRQRMAVRASLFAILRLDSYA